MLSNKWVIEIAHGRLVVVTLLHSHDEEDMLGYRFHNHAFSIVGSILVVAQQLETLELNFLKFRHPNIFSFWKHLKNTLLWPFCEMCRERNKHNDISVATPCCLSFSVIKCYRVQIDFFPPCLYSKRMLPFHLFVFQKFFCI